MSKLQFITIGLILICFTAYSQKTSSVEVFNGRGDFRSCQKILDLSHQNLKQFPISTQDPEIETLILDNNNIKELPSWIGMLTNLKVLSIRNNSFEELDIRINYCENLEQLYLSGNKDLSDISAISTNMKLQIIDVVDTKINELPSLVQMMDHLCYFKYTKKE